jgi:hypothetical protein
MLPREMIGFGCAMSAAGPVSTDVSLPVPASSFPFELLLHAGSPPVPIKMLETINQAMRDPFMKATSAYKSAQRQSSDGATK